MLVPCLMCHSECHIPGPICQPLGHSHLTRPPQHHPQLVALEDKVDATRGAEVQRRGGGGDEHVPLAH